MPVLSPRRHRRQLEPPPFVDLQPSLLLGVSNDESRRAPNIMEFVRGKEFLDRPSIYPRQATLLKLIFLERELLTDYDRDVLNEWSTGFRLGKSDTSDMVRYDGGWGIAPDWEARMDRCIAEGRPWFREVLTVIGRRGSKGFIGAAALAYVLWNYILLGDPHKHFGVDDDKRLVMFVFAGKKEQAKSNQWADIVNVILGAPIFRGYIADVTSNRLAIYARSDYERWKRLQDVVGPDYDYATFDILPKESTVTAGRGPASFAQAYDEMAFVDRNTARASAEEVYGAATPALDTFGHMAFLYEGSSPWQMIGQYYENWQQALAVDPDTGEALRPEMLVVQLQSWDLYQDWEIAHELPDGRVAKDGNPICFDPLSGPIQAYDDQMKRLERANPERFAVERRAQWATVQNAYLNPQRIEEQFAKSFDDGVLRVDMPIEQSTVGRLDVRYEAHVDPSKSGDNTGMAVAHLTERDADGLQHVVIDRLHAWVPADFPDHQIDYLIIEEELKEVIGAYMPNTLSFDQFGSPNLLQRLGHWARTAGLPKRVQVDEQTATAALNWKMAECFKTALGMNLIHAPRYDLYELECKFLMQTKVMKVDHPSSGPVQSKDVVDAVMNVTWRLIGTQMMAFLFDGVSVSGSHTPPEGTLPGTNPSAFPRPIGRSGQMGMRGRR